jgi:hypothetical protein
MFQPVGSEPASVYWRRRVILLASVLALIILLVVTVRVLFSDSGSSSAAAGRGPTAPAPTPPAGSGSTSSSSALSSSAATSSSSSSSASRSASGSASSSAPPEPCGRSALGLAADSEKSRYSVGDQPVLSLLVTNKTDAPCVQDLADPQIVLRVYNGESRVWGSHDCKIEPGTDDRTLMPRATVRVSIVWSGLTSQPNCAGHRQRVGAGTYTLYASLAGREGRAAQFTIS